MRLASAFRSHGFGSGEMRAGVEPTGQHLTLRECHRLSGEVGEYRLCHILRQVRVAVNLTQGRRVDEIQISPHQFGEGFFRTLFGVAPEQFGIWCHSRSIAPGSRKTGHKRSRDRPYLFNSFRPHWGARGLRPKAVRIDWLKLSD